MKRNRFRLVLQMLLCLGTALPFALPALAQVPVDENGNPIRPLEGGDYAGGFADDEVPLLGAADLEALVGPVALYPDDLLAVVLPASTYPLQVVQAARFLERLEDDPSLKPDEDWDESITALLNYPEIVELMNEDIDWTWRLGEAVVAQQADVIAAIESFRDKAYAAGNLKSDEHQTVSNADGVIEIEPVDEDVIYVPYYEPERVVVYQPYPVYHYYPRPYPLYYYPYPYGYRFYSDYFWGVTTAFTIGWLTDHLHVYHHSYWGHPYYGHHYHHHHYYRRPTLAHFNDYYVNHSRNHWNYRYRDGDYWRPRRHGGARPGHQSHRVNYYQDRDRHEHSTGRWASSREYDGHDGRRERRDRDADDRRNRDPDGNRQARQTERGTPANRRSTGNAVSQGPNDIRFRPRLERGDGGRDRSRESRSPSRQTQHRASFAPPARSASEPADGDHGGRFRSPSGSRHERGRPVAMNDPRQRVAAPPPRQPVRAAPAPTVQRAPHRAQAARSEAPRRAAAPAAPQRSGESGRRAESRAARTDGHDNPGRSGTRVRRR